MLTPERVESQHRRSLRPLAESIEHGCSLAMGEGRAEIELGEGGVGGLEARPQDAALIAPPQVESPAAVGLVLEHVAPDQSERILEGATGLLGRFAGRALQQLVEPIEVERDELGREPVGLGLGDDERARPIPVGGEVAAKTGDERLQRAGGVSRALVSPDEVGEAVGCHAMSACRQQDLEHLLWVWRRRGPRGRGGARPPPSRAARTAGSPAAPSARARRSFPRPHFTTVSLGPTAHPISSPPGGQFVTDLPTVFG